MRKGDAFDSLLAAAGADPFKFGPKSMNQIREHQQKQQSGISAGITEKVTVQQDSNVPQQSQQPINVNQTPKKFRQPSIDISGLEDLDQSPSTAANVSSGGDVFDVFSDVGATDIPQQPQQSSFQTASSDSLPFQQKSSDAVAIQQDLVRINESQELNSQLKLSKSTPNIQNVNDIVKQEKRESVSSPPTPPNESEDSDSSPRIDKSATIDMEISERKEFDEEHQLQDVVLRSQARRQGSARTDDGDGLKNMWNGFAKSAKNFSKNISKKVNEFVVSPTTLPSQPQSYPSLQQHSQPLPSPSPRIQNIQEYQEFLAIAVAKMPTEDKRKKFISRLESEDREAVLMVFREQRRLEGQFKATQQQPLQQQPQQQNYSGTNSDSSSPKRHVQDDFAAPKNVQSRDNSASPQNNFQSPPQPQSNLVDIHPDVQSPNQQSQEGNFLNVMDDNNQQYPTPQEKQYSAQPPQKGGNNPQDLFAFDDNFSSNPAPSPQNFSQQQQQQQSFLDDEDPLAELLGGGNVVSEENLMLGGDLMDMEDEDLVQLVNAKCEELAVPGEPLQRKEFRRIRLMQEAKKVRDKMLWKQDMEAREEKAKEDKLRVKEEIMAEINQWKKESTGIQGYLCNLHKVLWEGAEWKPVPLSELLEPNKVRKTYLKAQLVVHPDKVNQKFDGNPPAEIAARADMIADILKESMAKFQ